MSKHTPGPWFYEPQEDNGDPVEDPSFFTIHGPQYFADVHVLTIHENHSIAEANARLIAAAPDMLAALHDLVEHYTSMINSGDCGNWNPEEERPVMAARAAIAKAEGEAA